MNNIRRFIISILNLFPVCYVIPILLHYLKEKALLTPGKTDDNIVEALEVAFKFCFPSCIDNFEEADKDE